MNMLDIFSEMNSLSLNSLNSPSIMDLIIENIKKKTEPQSELAHHHQHHSNEEEGDEETKKQNKKKIEVFDG